LHSIVVAASVGVEIIAERHKHRSKVRNIYLNLK
jgi:hypothetical protein